MYPPAFRLLAFLALAPVFPGERSMGAEPGTEAGPLLFPGFNAAMGGSAFESSVHDSGKSAEVLRGDGPGAAIDGLPGTSWVSASVGPCTWHLDWSASRRIGAVAILWLETPPPSYLLEGAGGDGSWVTLAEVAEGGDSGRLPEVAVHGFDALELRQLRLSVPETSPGQRVSMREFAVYPSLQDVPSAWMAEGFPKTLPDTPMTLGGSEEPLSSLQLGTGWRVRRHAPLPGRFLPKQLVLTAADGAFLLTYPEGERESGRVLRVSGSGNGLEFSPYLEEVPPASTIAWDGEWLYLLSRGRLEALRGSRSGGPADERHRLGPVFSSATGTPENRIKPAGMRLAADGWIYARIETEVDTVIISRSGDKIELPRNGIVRFRRDGSGLALVVRSDLPLSEIRLQSPTGLSVETVDESVGAFVLAPLPLPIRFDSTGAVPCFRRVGDKVYSVAPGREGAALAAKVGNLVLAEGDGPRIWLVGTSGSSPYVAVLEQGTESEAAPDWDELKPAELLPWFRSNCPAVRREAGFELARRKEKASREIGAVSSGEALPDSIEGVLAYLSGIRREESRGILRTLARSENPRVQSAVFGMLADPEFRPDPSDFASLGTITDPRVSAAILAALHLSRTSLPGAEAIAWTLAVHPDPSVSETALAYLLETGIPEDLLGVIADPAREKAWEVAFSLLVESPDPITTGKIASLVYDAPTPRHRKLALAALGRIHARLSAEDGLDGQRREIETALQAALFNHRVDRVFLLGEMTRLGIPFPGGERLVPLARENPSLESFVLERLAEESGPLSSETRSWLSLLAGDPDREAHLRRRALAQIAGNAPTAEYRSVFREVARRDASIPSPYPGMGDAGDGVLEHWLAREDHSGQESWLVGQSRGSDRAEAVLAWSTLLTQMRKNDRTPVETSGLETHFEETIRNGGLSRRHFVAALGEGKGSAAPEWLPRILKAEGASLDAGLLEEAGRVSARLRLEATSGLSLSEPVRSLAREEIRARLGSRAGNPTRGGELFHRHSCGACHWTSGGEGDASGPVPLGSTSRDWLDRLLSPQPSGSGVAFVIRETKDGRHFAGVTPGGKGGDPEFRDRAGNRLSLPEGGALSSRPLPPEKWPCLSAGELSLPDFGDLLSFLEGQTQR